MTKPPAILDFLIQCLRVAQNGAEQPPLAPDDIDWEALVQLSLNHHVTPLLCVALIKHGDAMGVPTEIRDACRVFLDNSRTAADKLALELQRLLGALTTAGITAVPFKGPLLAQQIYGDIGLRVCRDLDFLIYEHAIEPTLTVLRNSGYRIDYGELSPKQIHAFHRYSGQDIGYGENGIAVEPHWAFTASTLAVDIDHGSMIQRAVSVDFAGQPTLSFDPEDTLLILCVHGSKELWGRLKWISDVAAFLVAHPNLDWPELWHRAAQQGCSRMIRLGLLTAKPLLSSAQFESITGLTNDPVAARLSRTVWQTIARGELAEPNYTVSPIRFRMRERTADRLRYLFRTVTTPREKHFLLMKLPDNLFFGYYPVKLVHDYVLLPVHKALKTLR